MLACTRRCAENCAYERVVRARAPDCTSEAALQLGFACEILPFALLLAHLHVTLPMASSPLGNDVCLALQYHKTLLTRIPGLRTTAQSYRSESPRAAGKGSKRPHQRLLREGGASPA